MNRSRRVAIVACAALTWTVPAEAQERPPARAVDAVAGIVDAFDRYPVVALGEDHGNVAQHDFLRRLVADPRFARAADAVVIEAGSAAHQRVVDRFIAGKRVSRKALAASWRDSIGGGHIGTWDAPVYEQFLRAIRRANRGRPDRLRVRVLLGDPPVRWNAVRTPADVERWGRRRDTHYASVVDRQVLRKGKRALLIAGVFHLQRDPDVPIPNALTLLDRLHPGKVYNVALPPYEHAQSFPADSLVPVDGTDLGALRPPRPPAAPPARAYEEYADAWFVPDRAKDGWFSHAYPNAFPDRWWNELRRRNQLEMPRFDPAAFFGVRCSYRSIQGRGLRQPVRIGAAAGEPRAGTARPAGRPPQATGAAAAVAAQLRAGKVVAIGDAMALEQEHAFLRELVESRALPGRPVIVVGFGNSLYQRVVDAYLDGAEVPSALLARVWQDTSQLLAYDSPEYEQFFKKVREANAELPAGKRIRVLLGEPPLDWSSVDSARHVRAVAARRAAFMARLVKRHSSDGGNSVLLVADRRLVARVPGSVTDRLPSASSWVLEPYVGFGSHGAALEDQLGDPSAPAALTIRGSWLAALRSGANLAPSRSARPLERTADALLYLGSAAALSTRAPLPTQFRDRFRRAIERRHRLVFGTRLDARQAFPTSLCSTPPEQVGEPPEEPGAPAPGGQVEQPPRGMTSHRSNTRRGVT